MTTLASMETAPRHVTQPPEWALRLFRQRHGEGYVPEPYDARTTALLVIDMQLAFTRPGAALAIPYAPGIIAPIHRAASRLRERGGQVIWIQTDFSQQRHAWSEWFGRRLGPAIADRMIETLSPQHPDYALDPALDYQPTDLTVVKTRFSPFSLGASPLHPLLQARGIRALWITGTVSNTCCESTARDAMMLNYRTLFLADANAARTDTEHQTTLGNMLQVFADVGTIGNEDIPRLL